MRGRGASSAAGSAEQAEANAKALADYKIPKKGDAPEAVTVETHLAPPVKIEPISIPDGALMVKESLPLFFEGRDKASYDDHNAIMGHLTEQQMKMTIDYYRGMSSLQARALHAIHLNEMTRIRKECADGVAAEKEKAEKAVNAAKISQQVVRKQLQAANEKYEDMDVKFLALFGVQIEEWGGTAEEILGYLDAKNSQG